MTPSVLSQGNTAPQSSGSGSTDNFSTHVTFSEIAHLYDGFILDQFGVMHNGKDGLEGAPECVAELAKRGKKLIILSNSSSLSTNTITKLPKLGFDPSNFVGAVTSGQEASHYIVERYQGKKALYITWKSAENTSATDFLKSCGDIEIVNDPKEADFVLLHGTEVFCGPDGEERSVGSFSQTGDMSVLEPVLSECCSKGIPMVCANPDFIMVKPDGSRAHMPGTIAQHYQDMGGDVTVFGKPHVEHFEACLRDLGLPKDRVCHVGDSLHHDIVGANATGIASAFVTGGVHRQELESNLGELPSNTMLTKLFEEHGIRPTHVVPLLKM